MFRCFFGLFGVLKLALVDCAFHRRGWTVAYIRNATSMPGLRCPFGRFYGLNYVVLLWFALCDCLC
jgi:hypothetical protein